MIKSEFSRIYEVRKLSDGDSDLSLEAAREEADALAKRFDLESLDSLTAKLHLTVDQAAGSVCVQGSLDAEFVQTCVVTLKPLPASVHASIVRKFLTNVSASDSPLEIDLSETDDDEPEPIINGKIDFGEIVAEQLGLEIDPFPRAPGSEFTGFSSDSAENQPSEADSEASSGPFAALARLKEPKQK